MDLEPVQVKLVSLSVSCYKVVYLSCPAIVSVLSCSEYHSPVVIITALFRVLFSCHGLMFSNYYSYVWVRFSILYLMHVNVMFYVFRV